jgi:hypothetical protein
MEAAWLPGEVAGFAALRPWLSMLEHGDGHPVLVLPGFTATDRSTAGLRAVVRDQGYWAHRWKLGRNLGPSPRIIVGMRDRLAELHQRHGRAVTIIGQSLGGIYARALARERPELVRQVISLGSPYRMTDGDSAADRVRHLQDGEMAFGACPEHDRPPLGVPATSVYSRTDGIAPWHTCIDADGERCENIEVRGSHIGMAVNPAVIVAVLDRLAQPEGHWRPFVAPPVMRAWYPRATRWHHERPPRAA